MSETAWAFSLFKVALLKSKGFHIEIAVIETGSKTWVKTWSLFTFHYQKFRLQKYIQIEILWFLNYSRFIPGLSD